MLWTSFQVIRLILTIATSIPLGLLGLALLHGAARSADADSLVWSITGVALLSLSYLIVREGKKIYGLLTSRRSNADSTQSSE